MSMTPFSPGTGWELTGLAIRQWLVGQGDGSAWDFWQAIQEKRKAKDQKEPSYAQIRRYFWIIKKMGLIIKSGERPSKFKGNPKAFYQIVPGMRDDPRWFRPQSEFYPSTTIGSRRFQNKVDNDTIQRGRNPKYIGR